MKAINHTLVTLIALTFSAYAQPEPQVPFDLEKFQPVLSQCRLHSPSTSPATVSAGNFGGYELPGRFYLGAEGTTMVLATPTNDRGRSELRHNSGWSFLGPEKRYTARLRFDKPVALGGMRSRLHVLQIYGTGTDKGPTVLVTWVGSWDDSGSEDRLQAYVKGTTTHNLGPRPEGFFDLDVRIEEGILRIFIDDELKVEDDVSNQSYAGGNFFFKTGNYHRGIEAHAVEFDSLSITTAPPAPGLMLEPADGESTTVAQGGDPDAYTVVLNRAPTEDVNVNLTPGNLVTVYDEDGTAVTFVRGEPVDGIVTVTANINGTPIEPFPQRFPVWRPGSGS